VIALDTPRESTKNKIENILDVPKKDLTIIMVHGIIYTVEG
jgi:hypothetical protein